MYLKLLRKIENCFGEKRNKVRLTGIVAGNTRGEKHTMFVIGKSKRPRCPETVKSLPCE